MDQQKTGAFLKQLRKDKGLTQEQLAEHFNLSSRTVSRWETGRNLPSVDMLIELADFYDVDIRQIIDAERKSEHMDQQTKDTLKKVAAYATKEEKRSQARLAHIALGIAAAILVCAALFMGETKGLLYGIVPEQVCHDIMLLVYGLSAALLVSYLRVHWFRETPSKEPEKSVMATVVSKEVEPGTHGAGRSNGGYSYVVSFLAQDGQTLALYAHEIEFGGLKEGMRGLLTFQGRYFVNFHETTPQEGPQL